MITYIKNLLFPYKQLKLAVQYSEAVDKLLNKYKAALAERDNRILELEKNNNNLIKHLKTQQIEIEELKRKIEVKNEALNLIATEVSSLIIQYKAQ